MFLYHATKCPTKAQKIDQICENELIVDLGGLNETKYRKHLRISRTPSLELKFGKTIFGQILK